MFWLKRRIWPFLPWLIIAVISSGVTLLVKLPAAWVTPRLTQITQGRVNLIDPSGSIWQGSAVLMLAAGTDASAATQLPGRIEWQTHFWPLLRGRLQIEIRQTEAMPNVVTLDASPTGATLSAGRMVAPAALLSGLGAPFNTLDLQGSIHLTWTDWRVLEHKPYGKLTVTFSDVISRISRVKPLGSYEMTYHAQGALATLDLLTLKGPLLLSGHGAVTNGGLSFQGEASASADQKDNLAGLLSLLGRPTGSGTFSLNYGRSSIIAE